MAEQRSEAYADILQEVGVTNVKFTFSPDGTDVGPS